MSVNEYSKVDSESAEHRISLNCVKMLFDNTRSSHQLVQWILELTHSLFTRQIKHDGQLIEITKLAYFTTETLDLFSREGTVSWYEIVV